MDDQLLSSPMGQKIEMEVMAGFISNLAQKLKKETDAFQALEKLQQQILAGDQNALHLAYAICAILKAH